MDSEEKVGSALLLCLGLMKIVHCGMQFLSESHPIKGIQGVVFLFGSVIIFLGLCLISFAFFLPFWVKFRFPEVTRALGWYFGPYLMYPLLIAMSIRLEYLIQRDVFLFEQLFVGIMLSLVGLALISEEEF